MCSGKRTVSGVWIFDNLLDNIIIDRYDPILHKMRSSKKETIRSEHSEDALTWNTFKTLKQIDPSIWLPHLFKNAFQKEYPYSQSDLDIKLWERIPPSGGLETREGQTEVDVILENDHFIWSIEAKYLSDISMNTTHEQNRDQIIRNIDVGSTYANEKDYYFSLLILNEKKSPKGVQLLKEYKRELSGLPHRDNQLDNLNGIGLLTWEQLANSLLEASVKSQTSIERFLAFEGFTWLTKRINVEM